MIEKPEDLASEVSVLRGALISLSVALSLTLLMAAPVVQRPSERLFGSGALGREDPNRDALIVIEQLRTGRVVPPYLQPLTDIPGRFLARLVSPVAAYNLLVLATFPLSACAAYLLARYALGSHLAAMVAGLAYAFLPFHVAQATGHPHVAQTQWLPLYLLALWRCLDRPGFLRALLLLASAAAVVLADFYGGLIAAVLSPVALVAYGAVSPRQVENGLRRRLMFTGSTLALALAAGLITLYEMAPAVVLRPRTFAVPRSELFLYSARWWSYLVPTVDHPLAGTQVRDFWVGRGLEPALLEQQVSVGWSLLVLGAIALGLSFLGDRTSLALRSVPVLASLAFAALVCSLSPERTVGAFTFVRPSALLYEIAPMFRAYARFGVMVGLMTALLAGAGAATLWRRPGRTARLTTVLLLGLAALEFAPFPPWRWRDVLPTGAHRWLAAQHGTLRVLDCVPPSASSVIWARSLFPHQVSFLVAAGFEDCAEPRLGEKLEAKGFTHAVVRRDGTMGQWFATQPDPQGLVRGPAFEDALLLEVRAEAPSVYVDALLGFYPRERDLRTSWRWMGQTASIRLVATRPVPETTLTLELEAFPRRRRVEVSLDGTSLAELQVAAKWGRHAVPLGPLSPGRSLLTLTCSEPAVVANDIIRNLDHRQLGLAIGAWTFEDGEASPIRPSGATAGAGTMRRPPGPG